METLRECQTSLLISAPDHDVNVRKTERIHNGGLVADRRSLHAGQESGGRASQSYNVTDKFDSTYRRPEINCKEVSFQAAKRAFDVLFAITFLFFMWPFMAIVALIIKLTSRGPVIFRQTRV